MDTPPKRPCRSFRFCVDVAIVAGAILYLLSFGPACWLHSRGFLGGEATSLVYWPVISLAASTGQLPAPVKWYACIGARSDDFPIVLGGKITWNSQWEKLTRSNYWKAGFHLSPHASRSPVDAPAPSPDAGP